MALVESITYESSPSEFLQEKDTQTAADSFGKDGLAEIESSFTNEINNEMEKGLSLEALSIDGRAPLNEVAREILSRISVTMDDIEDLKKIVEVDGNIHRKDEATRYYEEVKKRYKELYDECEAAVNAYNVKDHRKYIKSTSDEGEPEYAYYSEISISEFDYENDITISPKPNSRSKYADAVTTTEQATRKFYVNKVRQAKQLFDACNKLNTSYAGMGVPITDSEKALEGVQPGATKKSYEGTDGNVEKEVYTNPDGSTVTIKYGKGGKVTSHIVNHRDGWIQQEVKYDKDGKPTKKIVYEQVQLYEKESLYKMTPTEYEYKDGNWSEEGIKNEEGSFYQWRNNEGKIITGKPGDEEPNLDDVAEKVRYTNADYALRGGTVNNGTAEVEPKEVITSETYDYAYQAIKSGKDFILEKGDKIIDDRPNTPFNTTFYSNQNDIYFEYDADDKCFYAKNENGEYIDSYGYVTTKEQLKEWGVYIDQENFLNGTGQSPINDPDGFLSNNSRIKYNKTEAS